VICESSGGYERGLVRALEKLDLLIKEHIEQSPGLSAKAEKLTSIKGVGLRTAALLLAQMPELGQLIVVKLQLWSA
jgi:transposase